MPETEAPFAGVRIVTTGGCGVQRRRGEVTVTTFDHGLLPPSPTAAHPIFVGDAHADGRIGVVGSRARRREGQAGPGTAPRLTALELIARVSAGWCSPTSG